ncbi:MAG: hypothetical protein LCH89_04685 [Proteobacteria bacterium]|nr:hypothetical protein [Pseudomonadota bacterium]
MAYDTGVHHRLSRLRGARLRDWARILALAGFLIGGATALRVATSAASLPELVDLNAPPVTKQDEPSNVALALSVEFPTVGAAYRGYEYVHDPVNNPYLGYWDVRSCYRYKQTGSADLGGEYFYRVGATDTNGYCGGDYSGNLLNYVATSAIDVLRMGLTGGHRVVDTVNNTVLERAYLYSGWTFNQGTYFPAKRINKTYVGQVMPADPAPLADPYVYGGNCANVVWFGRRTTTGVNCMNPVSGTTSYGDLNPRVGGVYQPMYARVRVCDGVETSRPDFCQRHPAGNYKPVGQVQLKSDGTRLSAFGYLADNNSSRYGGVLRAPMGYVGPTMPNASGVLVANPAAEWDANTGIFVDNPLGATGFAYSGVIHYLNRFGTTGTLGNYKGLDPVGELYYETLRYYMGLGPTPDATSGLTAAMYDGFPVYTSWQDPVLNACHRKNYTLVIGDVNTHYDKQLPGHGGAGAIAANDGVDAGRGAESLLGGGTFNAADWTKVMSYFETGATGLNYTNSLGVAVTTRGNPDPNANNNNLNSKTTGSGGRAAYYWAGAAYWAHTQPIRNDNDSSGKNKNGVRVNTFTIDVDEGGNGLIDGNTRGIQPRQSSFYLAGKYGWFNNTDASKTNPLQPLTAGALGANEQLDGHPFRNALTGALDNSRWEYAGEPNTPDGYVIASQATKMQAGIQRFFSSIGGNVVPPTVSALSSLNFSSRAPDGDVFVPQFESKTWGGTLLRTQLTFNPATGALAVGATRWSAGKILTDASVATGAVADPYVKPADRKIFTYAWAVAYRGGQEFSVAEKSKIDTEILNGLAIKPATAPTSLSNSDMQDANINWLRGDRSLEAGAGTGYLRSRSSVMGDVVNSGPVYKQGADPNVIGPGYATFAATQANRAAVVYVGVNDGMLHAFRASDGKELFAYLPKEVAKDVNKLADPDYVHRPYVDAIPTVGEAEVLVSGTSTWKTLLVSGMGGGAQGIFGLDVTDPENFSKSNVMFEFTDRHDSDMGNVLGQPRLVRMKLAGSSTTRWFVAVTSGYNNYQADGRASTTGQQVLFLLSVDKPVGSGWVLNNNYYKVKLPAPATTTSAALANPGVAYDTEGNAVIFYAGDTQGNLWKFDFQGGINSSAATNAVKTSGGTMIPMAILRDATSKPQPVTTVPAVAPGLNNGYMVLFGTGKFIESDDASSSETNAVYGIWDNLSNDVGDYQITTSKLYQRSFDSSTGQTTGSATFTFGTGSAGTYRGWYANLPISGERIAVDPDTRLGYTAMNSLVPPADCTAKGSGATMTFGNLYGSSQSPRTYQTVGYLGRPQIVLLDMSPTSSSYTYGARGATGRRDITVTSTAASAAGGSGVKPTVLQSPLVQTRVPAGRVGWREVKNF